MSGAHHLLLDVIYTSIAIILLLSNSVGSNRIYETDDSLKIKGSVIGYATSSLSSNIVASGQRWPYTTGGQRHFGPRPSLKLPQLNNLMEGGATITRNICRYVEEDGRQVYEVCWRHPADLNILSDGIFDGRILTTPVYLGLQQSEFHFQVLSYPSLTLPPQQLKENAIVLPGRESTYSANVEEDRVVGGTEATKNSWPGMVLLKLGGEFRCGGTLISPTKILTAAHCIYGLWPWDISRLTVELGIHVWSPDSDAQVVKKVQSAVGHPLFLPDIGLANDVAVLTLDSPVTYTSTISAVSLPPADSTDQYTGQKATLVGWGMLSDGGTLSPTLQQATIDVISKAQCSISYLLFYLRGLAIKSSMLCATSPGIGSCNGDSGGPLFVKSTSGSSWIQAGIVSFGLGCASPIYPSVYTRVSSFLPWIKKHM